MISDEQRPLVDAYVEVLRRKESLDENLTMFLDRMDFDIDEINLCWYLNLLRIKLAEYRGALDDQQRLVLEKVDRDLAQ